MFSQLQISSVLLGLLLDSTSAGLVAQKRADICGSKGWDRGKGNYFYSESKTLATYTACSNQCVSDSKCKSFGYSNQECMLFNIALSGNFDADSSSSDTYYDRGCIKSASSSSASSSASFKTTVSSTQTTVLPTTTSKPAASSTSKTTAPGTLTISTPVVKLPSSSTRTTSASSHTSTSVSGTSTTSSGASASVTVPAGCTIPSPISITAFTWFNSTHNLDCTNPNYPSTAQVCWNSTSLCTAGDAGCTCTPYCYTGLPSYAYQPLGFGPPDTINVAIGGSSYSGANPQSVRRWEIGEGHFDSGTGPDTIGFYGDSNKDTGNTGSLYYNDYYGATCNGVPARYTASFPLICSHDAGNNATCTTTVPLQLTFNGYT